MRIPCAIYRGGTSKPVFFLEDDLPKNAKKRDAVVLEAFGTPDVRQIDGLGGADPLTSKVAYIGAPPLGGRSSPPVDCGLDRAIDFVDDAPSILAAAPRQTAPVMPEQKIRLASRGFDRQSTPHH
jgi:hypothetical protein